MLDVNQLRFQGRIARMTTIELKKPGETRLARRLEAAAKRWGKS
jgi:hypothetical protein